MSKSAYWHAHWHSHWHSRAQLACLLALSLRNWLRSRGWGAVDPPAFARQSRVTGTLVSVNRDSLASCDSQSTLHWHSRHGVDPSSPTPIVLAASCRFLLTPARGGCSRACARAGAFLLARGLRARASTPPGPTTSTRARARGDHAPGRHHPTTPRAAPAPPRRWCAPPPRGARPLPADHPPRVRPGARGRPRRAELDPRRGGARAMRAITPGIPPCVRAPGRAIENEQDTYRSHRSRRLAAPRNH